jgi:hypothetical protein
VEKSPLNAKTTKMCSYHLQRDYVKQHFNINGFLNSLIDDQTVRVLENLWTMKQYFNGTLCFGM